MSDTLLRLDKSVPCQLFVAWMQQCRQPAHWAVNGEPVCDEHIEGMADLNGDNEAFLQPALRAIRTGIPRYFALLAESLQAIAGELEIEIADIHEIECAGSLDGKGWTMHINNERFAEVRPGWDWRGKLEVCFSAWYSDFTYLLLQVGSRVRILVGDYAGQLGTVYNHLPSRPAPWHVRPDLWPQDEPGIAYTVDELEVIREEEKQG